MLIDFHVHLYDEAGYSDALVETARNLGLSRMCIGGGEARYGLAPNGDVRRLADAYPDLFVPFARLNLGRDGPDTIERIKRMGFRGLRTWAPPAPYDDQAFFAVYEVAEALGMPIVFHTGFLPPTALDRAMGVRSANMRPVYLDTVARCFPELKVIGAALGRPWYEEAVEAMRRHPNVYFDLSGDLFRTRGTDFLAEMLRPAQVPLWEDTVAGDLCERIIFGSGCRYEEIASAERDYQRVLRALGLSPGDIEAVMGHSAARLLDIELDRTA